MPWVRQVLPAPRGPVSRKRSPGWAWAPMVRPMVWVSSALPLVMRRRGRHLAVVVPSRLGGRNVFAVFVQHRHLAGLAVCNPTNDGGAGNPVDYPVYGVRRRGEEKYVVFAAGEGFLQVGFGEVDEREPELWAAGGRKPGRRHRWRGTAWRGRLSGRR